MDVEITPEPTEEERAAILRALELEREEREAPPPWRERALGAEPQAGAPPRQSRGATRA